MSIKRLVPMVIAAFNIAACNDRVTMPSHEVVHVSNYDDLSEGFLNSSFSYDGVNYRDANNIGGAYPTGNRFVAEDVGKDFIIENAKLLYDAYPTWGSPTNALTFGDALVDGDNVSLGAFVTAWMDLQEPADSIRFETVFYEKGPWGGIVIHLDVYNKENVVGSDAYTIASSALEDRDDIAFSSLSVSGVQFDSCHIYATIGSEYSAPRMMIDNLTIGRSR
jgi:hypothetical protein